MTALRAAFAVVVLIGFYVFAFGIVAALALATLLLIQLGPVAAKLGYVTVVVAVAVIGALWRVLRAKPAPPSGLPVSPENAPELWQMVRDLAAATPTRAPDQILLVPVVNAAVSEQVRLLGLFGGRRTLYLGVPLLQALRTDELRSVLAHELGHYSRRHTRLGEVAYRGREGIQATLAQLRGRFTGWLLRQYAKVYLVVSSAVSRRQELEADELSVRVAGKQTAQAALRQLPAVTAAWAFYENRFIEPAWSAGYAPLAEDLFRGFGELLAARTDELDAIRATLPPEERSRYDTHPPLADRIAAMQALPDAPLAPDADPRPSWQIIPHFGQAATAVAASSLKLDGRRPVPWNQLTTIGILTQDQLVADRVYRAAARFTGVTTPGLGTVLTLSAQRRLGEFAAEFFPNATRREAAQESAKLMAVLIRIAAVRSGVATWTLPWAGPAVLVRPDGSVLELDEIATLAVAPDTVDEARSRLNALGIDIGASVMVEASATAHGGEIIDGMATVKVDGVAHDMLILQNGLILIPGSKKTDGGKERLLAAVRQAPSLVALAKATRFIGLEDVDRVVVKRRSPVRVDITVKSGQTYSIVESWTGDRLTDNAAEAFFAVLGRFVVEPAKP